MSDNIPFDIQSEIMKRLPVKSLIQFRSVSKQWKSLIDSAKFIKNYHIIHTNPQHHLLVIYELDFVETYTSIVDNNTFPQQKFPLTAPEYLSLLRNTFTLSSVDGLVCFCGDVDWRTRMAVIWNPTVRKSVGIVIPISKGVDIVVGFGVCPDTSDPKLVKIIVDEINSMWEVDVFTLSTRVWKTVYTGVPFKLGDLSWSQVFVNGVIYFHACDSIYLDDGVRSNFVILFDLKSEKFGEVCLPERLVHAPLLRETKVNESLGLLEYYIEGGKYVCGVWTRKDNANKLFTKIYTIKVEWHTNGVGINGEYEHFVSKCPERNRNHEVNLNEAQEKGVYHEEGTFFMMNHIQETIFMNEEKYTPPKSESNTDDEDDVCNVINLGQATISGYDISIRGDFLTMRDSWGSLLIKVPRSANRLYKAQLKVGKEGTNEVGRESDKEENPHSSLVTVHETSPKSKEDHSRSDGTPIPIARLETIRLLIALAAGKGWKIHHLDVKTAFLNGDRKKLDSTLEEMGFLQCVHEKVVYRKVSNGEFIIIAVYGDDIFMTGTSLDIINEFKKRMAFHFEMSDLGELTYYLGIEVSQRKDCVEIKQERYARKILKEAGMEDCNATSYPMEKDLKLSKAEDEPEVQATQY
ncbi:uncharacterized mitochondrial protein-like protein [Tanacetum coccineum]|uniref:Uncharacterized mitochondrial protein-like protein n=1 Tax=Tanacetum coccineum TaxID=301880 RepID=A0ABQ5I466_9ASTR